MRYTTNTQHDPTTHPKNISFAHPYHKCCNINAASYPLGPIDYELWQWFLWVFMFDDDFNFPWMAPLFMYIYLWTLLFCKCYLWHGCFFFLFWSHFMSYSYNTSVFTANQQHNINFYAFKIIFRMTTKLAHQCVAFCRSYKWTVKFKWMWMMAFWGYKLFVWVCWCVCVYCCYIPFNT